ncbi:PepSY domain-containing protein [Pedobacter sp. SYSU D00535]|uniref:PepSY-associated TM helix domain-containing protein n=1 Tax=Pedobacter sp. SYSU D00535 TaxID=2810308 RepID=UPI001A978C96|nr:PepSY-associated TM helix domain-containing protein [Pedobacter sp. SYSU D00535]
MTKENKSWPRIRKFFNDVHLWLGLASGIIVLFVCLSGTIYVFNTEIREMAAPHLYKVKPGSEQSKLSTEKLIALVEKKSGGKVSSVKIPSADDRSYVMTVRKEGQEGQEGHDHKGERKGGPAPEGMRSERGKREQRSELGAAEGHAARKGNEEGRGSDKAEKGAGKGGEAGAAGRGPGGRGTQYMINPYTGEILGDSKSSKTTADAVMQFMFSLHRWLLLDKIEEPLFGELENRKLGSYISGTATILFTLGVITGIVIWFPQRIRNWKQGLKVKTSGNWKRTNHDLHNSLGFYSCLLLLLMGLTGPQWSFPWYREGLRKALGTHQAEGPGKQQEQPSSEVPSITASTLSVAELVSLANKQLPYEGDYTISLPRDSSGTVNIMKNKIGFFAPAAADKLVLDQYSGAVLTKEIFAEKPFNERVSGSIKALHIGDVYGLFSKILYFFACLIATSLPVTGTLIWINKLKKKGNKNTKPAKAPFVPAEV